MSSTEKLHSKWRLTQMLFLTGVVLSFLGWLWETIFSFFSAKSKRQRISSSSDLSDLRIRSHPRLSAVRNTCRHAASRTSGSSQQAGFAISVLFSRRCPSFHSNRACHRDLFSVYVRNQALELCFSDGQLFRIYLTSSLSLLGDCHHRLYALPLPSPLSCDRQNKAETSKRTFLGAACSCDSRCHIQFRLSVRKRPALRYSSLRQNHYRITAASGMIKKGRLPVPFYSSYTSFSITSMIHALSSETESADCTTRHPAFK